MDVTSRIERALNEAMLGPRFPVVRPGWPPPCVTRCFPRGARVRPRLCHSVAAACGEDHPRATDAAGAALELLHCASLVHDDLPCFDAAETRRGTPSVHKAFGEPLAVLTGDALIVLAFQTLARLQCTPERLATLTLTVGRDRSACPAASSPARPGNAKPRSISRTTIAPRPARCLPRPRWRARRRPAPIPSLGGWLARSSARPIRSPTISATPPRDEDEIGKPVGRDSALGRPSAVIELGLDGALCRLHELVRGAIDAMPPCPNGAELRSLMLSEAKRLVPAKLAQFAA